MLGIRQSPLCSPELSLDTHGAVTEPRDTEKPRHSDPDPCLSPSPQQRAQPMLGMKAEPFGAVHSAQGTCQESCLPQIGSSSRVLVSGTQFPHITGEGGQ